MNCKSCKKYNFNEEKCSLCDFEFDGELYWNDDDKWDILNLDHDYEWGHLQIMYRLESKGIECLKTDIWVDNNIAYIIGAKADTDNIASALGVHKEVVYDAGEIPLVIINLFQEKFLRGLL